MVRVHRFLLEESNGNAVRILVVVRPMQNGLHTAYVRNRILVDGSAWRSGIGITSGFHVIDITDRRKYICDAGARRSLCVGVVIVDETLVNKMIPLRLSIKESFVAHRVLQAQPRIVFHYMRSYCRLVGVV
jgi:hypothetical protein